MIFAKFIGNKGEDKAVREYRKRGYRIISRNFSCRFGELDIVAQKGETVVVAEVKTRKNNSFAEAKEFVDYNKQNRIRSSAKLFLQKNNMLDSIIRFDVVEVYTENNTVNIIENAF